MSSFPCRACFIEMKTKTDRAFLAVFLSRARVIDGLPFTAGVPPALCNPSFCSGRDMCRRPLYWEAWT